MKITKLLDSYSFDEPAEPHSGRTLNVARSWSTGWWEVRMHLVGTLHVLGQTTRITDAARYADLARYYLEQQGVRRARKTGYNFSEAQAKTDMQNNPEIVSLLGEILLELFPSGEMPKFKRQLRRATLRDQLNTVEQRLAKLAEEVVALKKDQAL